MLQYRREKKSRHENAGIPITHSVDQGCIFFPKIEFFYKSLFGASSFFINNNGQFFYKKR